MNNKLKKYIIILSILAVTIIVCIIILLNLMKSQKDDLMNEIIDDKESMGVGEFSEDELKNVNISELLQVSGYIDKFLKSTNLRSSIYYAKNENGEYVQAIENEYIYKRVLEMLSENFVQKNSIDNNNIFNFIDFSDVDREYTIIDIKKLENNNPIQYATYGILSQNDALYKFQYYIVTIDSANGIFAIEPVSDVNNIDEIKGDNNINLKKQTYNKSPNISVSAEDVAQYYFKVMKNTIMYDSDRAYNLLDKEYADKRFGSESKFKNYVDEYMSEIKQLNLSKYKQESIDNFKDRYLLVDQYQNIYTIETNTVSDFSIKLDTYTLLSDNFKEQYDSANEQQKVAMNIDKWIQMLNNRDYMNAYNVLDETFKNNNWKSEKEFEQYIKKYMSLHYDVQYTTYSNENSTYVQTIELKDFDNKLDSIIRLNIIMQLKDNYDFIMSFNVE